MARGNRVEKQFEGYKTVLNMQGEDALRQQLMSGLPSDNDLMAACNAVIEEVKYGTAEGFANKWQEFTDRKKGAMQQSAQPSMSAAAQERPIAAALPEHAPPPITGAEIPQKDLQATLRLYQKSHGRNAENLGEDEARKILRAGLESRINPVLRMSSEGQKQVEAIESNIDHILLPAITGKGELSAEKLQEFSNALFRLEPGMIKTTASMANVREQVPDVPGAPIDINAVAEEARQKVRRAAPDEVPHGNTPASRREMISAAGSKARAEEEVRTMAALVGNGTATLADDGSQVNAESLQKAIKASGVSDDNAAKLYRHAIQAVKSNDPNYFQNILDQYGGKIGVSDAEKVGLMNQVSALVELRQQQPSMERRADPPANAMRAEVQQKITSRDELNAAVGEAIPANLARALIHDDGTLGAAIIMTGATPQTINLLDGLSEREKNALQTVSQGKGAQEMCASDSAAPGCFVPYTPKNTPQNNR